MNVLFATTNPGKVAYYTSRFKKEFKEEYNVLTFKDLNMDIKINETGNNTDENAVIKAVEGYNATGYVTIANDCGLYINGLEADKQPGPYVRRVNGKVLTDSEMLEYYAKLVKTVGDTADAYWLHSYCVFDGETKYSFSKKSKIILKSVPSKTLIAGFPLNSLNYLPEFNAYRSEIDEEILSSSKTSNSSESFDFIKEALQKCINSN